MLRYFFSVTILVGFAARSIVAGNPIADGSATKILLASSLKDIIELPPFGATMI